MQVLTLDHPDAAECRDACPSTTRAQDERGEGEVPGDGGKLEDISHGASGAAEFWPLFLIVPEEAVIICNHLWWGGWRLRATESLTWVDAGGLGTDLNLGE